MQNLYEEYENELNKMALFQGIRDTELKDMLACMGAHIKTYKKDEFIIMREDDVAVIGVIFRGKVQMIREDLWGNRTIIVSLEENDLFGETFACGNQKNATVSFQTSMDTNVLFLPFRKVMHSCSIACTFHHRMIENMITLIAKKNVALIDKVDVLAKKSLREKIVTYLLQQSKNHNSEYFDIPLGRVQMADYLSADRSALTRELNSMKEEGWIDFEKNSFHILKNLELI